MIRHYKTTIASALVLGLTGFGAPATAAPSAGFQPLSSAASEAKGDVTKVQYWRRGWRDGRGYRHRHYRRDRGWGAGAAIAGGVVAGALIADAVRGASAADIARCEANYRSFDRSTGTYTTYGGETRVCPYLR